MAEPENSSLSEGGEQSPPSSAESEDSSEVGDLFRLLKRKAPEEEVLKVVDAASAKEKAESDGGLPLHWALEHRASHAVFEALLAAHPDAVKVKDNEGFLPLHNAVEWKASEEMFNELLEAYPDAVKIKENKGKLPLHLALREEASGAVVEALLGAHPAAAKEKTHEGELPLHWAAAGQASEDVVAALLGAYPEGAKEKSNDAWLPLHSAARGQASEAVIAALLEAHPEGAKEKNNEGELPLHIASRFKASDAVIAALLEANPEGVKEKDSDGDLPLHSAARYKAPEVVIAALLKAHPGATEEKNDRGQLPLHMAAWYKASDAVITALIGAADAFTTNTPLPPQIRARPRAAPITIGNGLPSISSITAMDDDKRENINCAEVGMSQHLSISTQSHPATFELLSDEILGKIMAHSSFAAGGFEMSSPAGRFACVSRRWNLVYREHREDFATNELRRVDDNIEIASEGPRGAGAERTIVDSWFPLGPQEEKGLPCWWTGGHFEGGEWSEEVVPIDAEAGPFSAIEAPTLVLRFDRKVVVRAIGVWARNKPRLVNCFIRRGSMNVESEQNTFAIGQGTDKLSFSPVFHRAVYDRLVAAKMPQGRPAAAMAPDEAIQSQLPELLPEPLTIDEGEGFCIKIMASQERQWVGINHLTIWE